jgi:hypothetical protein
MRLPDDKTELVVTVPDSSIPPSVEETIDPAILSRAYRHGWRAQQHFQTWTFDDVEAELRAAWLLNGETARWRSVKDAVRQGFEAAQSEDK